MRRFPSMIAGFAALSAALTAPAAHAQAINAVNATVNTTNVIINMNTQTQVGPGGVVLGAPVAIVAPMGRPHAASFWDHNKSVVALEASGNQRRFTYHRVRPGMAEAGARAGSLLFEGARVSNSYVGTAYVFAGRCGRFDYAVSGPVIGDRRVVMNGMAPRIDPRDCSIFGHRPDVLIFDLM